MFTRSILLEVGCSALAVACVSNGSEDGTRETIDHLIQAGFPASGVQAIDSKVYAGNDAEVSLPAPREKLESDSSDEQSRTSHLVAGPAPSVSCVHGAAFADPARSSGALMS